MVGTRRRQLVKRERKKLASVVGSKKQKRQKRHGYKGVKRR